MSKFISVTFISMMVILLSACSSIPADKPAAISATTLLSPTQSTPLLQGSAGNQISSLSSVSPGEDVSIETLENMIYEIQAISEVLPENGGQVKLKDGYFEAAQPNSASNIKVKLIKNAIGDLNRDSLEDGFSILSVETGGSGTFIYLIAITNQQGQPVQAAENFLGDRVKINSLRIENEVLHVDMQTHKETDPACCPSESITKKFVIEDEKFVEIIEQN
jgi:hypothetical protein